MKLLNRKKFTFNSSLNALHATIHFSLMEGEIRRLKIELDVYNKTILELRKKLEASSKQANQELVTSLQGKIKVIFNSEVLHL